jgi:hypothetical protein
MKKYANNCSTVIDTPGFRNGKKSGTKFIYVVRVGNRANAAVVAVGETFDIHRRSYEYKYAVRHAKKKDSPVFEGLINAAKHDKNLVVRFEVIASVQEKDAKTVEREYIKYYKRVNHRTILNSL